MSKPQRLGNLVDVGRGAKQKKQFSGDFPLNHNKQKCKMFPNNHPPGPFSVGEIVLRPGLDKRASVRTRGDAAVASPGVWRHLWVKIPVSPQ